MSARPVIGAGGTDPRGVGIMILAWALWSLDPIVVCRIGAGMPRALLAGLASLIAGLMVVPHVGAVFRRRRALSRRHVGLLLAQAALFTALCQVCYVSAIRLMNPGVVSAVLRTQMAAAVVLAIGFLGERLDRRALAGIALIAAANLGLLAHAAWGAAADRASVAGWWLALAAALLSSGGTVSSKALLNVLTPVELISVRLTLAGALTLLYSLATGGVGPLLDLTAPQWGWLLVKGIATTGLPFLLYNIGLQRMQVFMASAIEPFAPLFTILAAYGFLGKGVAPIDALGVAVIFAGSALVVLRRRPAAARA